MLKQLSLAFCFVCSAWGASLEWNASVADETHAAPTGYRIHRGPAPGVYDWQVDVGLALQWPIPDDLYGSFYWAASAYNGAVASGYSNEVYWTRAPPEPPQYVGASNLRASKLQQQGEPMAVAQTGTLASYAGYSAGGDINFTVPVDATGIVVILGYDQAGGTVSEVNCRNQNNVIDFTRVAYVDDANGNVHAYYMPSSDANWPGSGSKTLRWEITSAGNEDTHVIVFCVTGADTSSPIVDFETDTNGLGAVALPAMTGVGADDLSVAACWQYNAGTLDASGNSQTEIYDAGTWSAFVVAVKQAEDTMEIAAYTYSQSVALQFAIKASSGGSSSAVPKIMLLQDHFSGGIH